jgi:hypothetical protein
MSENYLGGIKEVINISSESITRCVTCSYLPNNLADAINHLLSSHGYQLLHIGTQSSLHNTGDIVHDTTAFLGR